MSIVIDFTYSHLKLKMQLQKSIFFKLLIIFGPVTEVTFPRSRVNNLFLKIQLKKH